MEFKPYKQKTIKWFFIILISILIGFPIAIYGYLKWATPRLDGEIILSGLKDKVEVYRDQEGIPHIFAQNDLDGLYSLGYIMASERLFQMEIARRLANGELAEIIGEKALLSDKMFRTLKLRKTMLDNFKHQNRDPKMLALINSFYLGINDYQFNNPLPIEFKLLKINPRPFTEADANAFIGYMSFSFAIGLTQDPLLTKLESRLGPLLVEEMRGEKINGHKSPVFTSIKQKLNSSKINELISFLTYSFAPIEGSNGWLLDKKRTKNNGNILANDPHISYSNPGVWFEAHLHTPQFETYGHFLPLVPFPVLSHNRDKAWGLTMSLTDEMDLYREKPLSPETYQYKNLHLKFSKSEERIKVLGQKDYKLKMLETHHGPILDEVIDEKNLALKWNFYDQNNDPITSFYQMLMSKNIAEFKSAVSRGISPGLNVLYADKNNIAWWMYGKIFIHPPHLRSDFILSGSSGRDEIGEELTFEERPFLLNPPSGVIVSANSRPINFPVNQRGDWQSDDRYKTILSILNQQERWNKEELAEVQTLAMNFEGKQIKKEIMDDLKYSEKNARYLQILNDWDLKSDENSIGASIYYSLLNQIGLNLLEKDLSKVEIESFGKLINSYTFLKRLILDRKNIWWTKFHRTALINKSFNDVINQLTEKWGADTSKWQWGKMHQLELNHPLGKIKILRPIFNIGPYPIAGSIQEINNQRFAFFRDTFNVTSGPSTRRIIDFSNINQSLGILPLGESGHLLSPFHHNQMERFYKGEYRSMLLDLNQINKAQTHHLILKNK